MADKLNFSLVSPESEVFAGVVDQVDVPGTEGDFGVFAQHAPFMAAIRTGTLNVFNDGTETQFFVDGGFADVTPNGLTILAKTATPLADVDPDWLSAQIKAAEDRLAETKGDERLDIAQSLDGLKAVQAEV